jgi:GT2 family glycosyltransferase
MVFLGVPRRTREIEAQVRDWVRACAGHPAVFCYVVGNEVPATLVRWHGRRRVERFIERLYRIAKEEDPDALVTYVNYPSTEYLRLPFLDFFCFNVYLESDETFAAYLPRLHTLSEDRPVVLAEIGLDTLRGGEARQAAMLGAQVRAAFRGGCSGVVVFSWTDEWYHGAHRVEDWAFGLTRRDRTPKPALTAVARAFAESPFPPGVRWPKISVVVCTYNGAATIRDTLEGLRALDYPDFEGIVVNDGSTDGTARIVSEYPFRVIYEENQGLSRARNTGIEAATGEIVAFIDDDAYPDPDWLRYLALAFLSRDCVAAGGPNLAPPGDGWRADAIANAPGGPNAVLLSDDIAEHIPGCNMAFRKDALVAIGGFDPRFRTAGDDVDVCWRLRDRGGVIAYAPGALVWHHRRGSFRRFCRQQAGYGKAEALLEAKWPWRYNALGQARWQGRIYGKGRALDFSSIKGRVYQGVWGTAPFQALYQRHNSRWALALMPEWYLGIAFLGLLSALGFGWSAWILIAPALLVAIGLPAAQGLWNALRSNLAPRRPRTLAGRVVMRAAIFVLHLVQPVARLWGRLREGLTPWRRRGVRTRPRYRSVELGFWRDQRELPETTLSALQAALRESGAIVRPGGDFDSWDLEVQGGLFGASRLLLTIEEHAPQKQLLWFRIVPEYSRLAFILGGLLTAVSVGAFASGSSWQGAGSAIILALLIRRTIADTGFSGGILRESLKRFEPPTAGEAQAPSARPAPME